MSSPLWIKNIDSKKTTRQRSGKQETSIARALKGKTTKNSGATFSQNDVLTDYCEVEAKITAKQSYSVKQEEYLKLRKKCHPEKLPVMVIGLEEGKTELAVLSLKDFLFLVTLANTAEK